MNIQTVTWNNTFKNISQMKREKAWVWFKGGINGGEWKAGFLASSCEESCLLIESSTYKSCKLPKWRVTFQEPLDINKGPEIPAGEDWKIS